MRNSFLIALLLGLTLSMNAKEGMWIPSLIEKLNYEDLQANGFKLSAQDIYSINQACLKDAVLIFGGGCTGEIISSQGLLLTNHHCGYSRIQHHSTVENNYLKKGFWAKNKQEELPNKSLKVSFLVSISDFTKQVHTGIDKGLTLTEEQEQIEARVSELETSISDTSNYKVSIESFYGGNEYYLFLYQEYNDVRLVGAPPASIGEFGGDTDNWVWPRHTGDFSIFRVYTAPDGSPAAYNEENIPYKPKKHLTISARSVKENDFTMVLGYPGRTFEYLYSGELEIIEDDLYKNRVKLRDGRLEIIDEYRAKDESIYIQYATKQARISNAWKKWKGVLYGFERFDVVEKKKQYEDWLLKNAGKHNNALQEIFEAYEAAYSAYEPYLLADNYFDESSYVIEPFLFSYKVMNALSGADTVSDKEALAQKLKAMGRSFYKNYNQEVDFKLTNFLLQSYRNDLDEEFQPEFLNEMEGQGELATLLTKLYAKSIFTDSNRYYKAVAAVSSGKTKAFNKDKMPEYLGQFINVYYDQIKSGYDYYNNEIKNINKEYITLIRAIDTESPIYSDANFTMRMTYGKVEGYSPSDAVTYHYQTYLSGVMQKSAEAETIIDYEVSDKLVELYSAKDFGRYADDDGRMPVCFLASNHTSGGNSGSPVLNNEGQLIGINFDRTWEGTMSDFNFDEEICRNISVDIRYILFIIDKFANCSYLVDEMDIVW